jgi:hypothetical protein
MRINPITRLFVTTFLVSTLIVIGLENLRRDLRELNASLTPTAIVAKPIATISFLGQDPMDISQIWIGIPIASMPTIDGNQLRVEFDLDKDGDLIIKFPGADDLYLFPGDKVAKIVYSGYESYTIFAHWDGRDNVKSWFVTEKSNTNTNEER